jgi:hypothetical protein
MMVTRLLLAKFSINSLSEFCKWGSLSQVTMLTRYSTVAVQVQPLLKRPLVSLMRRRFGLRRSLRGALARQIARLMIQTNSCSKSTTNIFLSFFSMFELYCELGMANSICKQAWSTLHRLHCTMGHQETTNQLNYAQLLSEEGILPRTTECNRFTGGKYVDQINRTFTTQLPKLCWLWRAR